MMRNLSQADRILTRKAYLTERAVMREYKTALDAIRKDLSVYYAKYDMTFSEMTKYNRLTGLEDTIEGHLKKLPGKTSPIIRKDLMAQYEESYYRTAFAIERESQVKLGYSTLNDKTVRRAIDNPLDAIKWPGRNRENIRTAILQTKQTITQGLIQGKSYSKMARDIKERLDVSATKAARIVQTEAHRVQQQGRFDSGAHAEKMGVNMVKVWVATLDGRTRDTHQSVDGAKVGVDEDFTVNGASGPYPGSMGDAAEDINCRCSFRFEIVGYEPEVRRSREDGTIPYTNYNDYADDKGWR